MLPDPDVGQYALATSPGLLDLLLHLQSLAVRGKRLRGQQFNRPFKSFTSQISHGLMTQINAD